MESYRCTGFVAVVQPPSCVQLFVTPWTAARTRLPCPSLSPGVCSNSCPLSHWRYLTISSSVAPFSFCHQSLPASGSFPMSQLFAPGGQNIGAKVLGLEGFIFWSGFFDLAWLFWDSSIWLYIFHSLVFFLLLNNIPLCRYAGHTMVYLFTCWWTFMLFPVFDYYK